MKERFLVTSFIEALDAPLHPSMRAYRDGNPQVGMVMVFRCAKTEVETVRAAFGRLGRTSIAGPDYPARSPPRHAGRR